MDAIAAVSNQRGYQVNYENWRKYLRIAYGASVGDEQLFVRHTYLATLAKLIAYVRITGAQTAPEGAQTQEIIQGTSFEKQQIANFLEEDFFSWVARAAVVSCTQRITSRLANLLFTYRLGELSEDVLKELYQTLVDPKDRHDLGEYYTPDWLAARMCNALLSESGEDAVLDPACGSGTFLYHAIQHKKRHLPATRQSLEKILGNVVGIDIHPLAVVISKMNILLALGDLFQERSGPVSIRVYLANSIRPPSPLPFIENFRVESLTPALSPLGERADHPGVFLSRGGPGLRPPTRRQKAALGRRAKGYGRSGRTTRYVRQTGEGVADLRPTVWSPPAGEPAESTHKPTALLNQFDVVIGNPPWLSFRFVEKGECQDYLKHLVVKEFGLLEGAGHLITHLELGTLFFARCATLYLKRSGKIGFVLPRSIFTADQHDRFRRSYGMGNTALTQLWDLEDVSPLFNVPAVVAFGDLISEASKNLSGEILSGHLKRRNASLEEAERDLRSQSAEFHIVQQGRRSYLSTAREKPSSQRSFYQPHFKEGATIVPRNFWFVEFKDTPGLGMDTSQPLVATDPRAEAEAKPPYRGIHFEAPMEAEFLYATLLSTDLLPFGHFNFRPVVLPLMEDAQRYRLLSADQARAKGYLKLPEWLDSAQQSWEKKRQEKARRMNILQRLDLQRGLSRQSPKAKYVVIYPKSATFLCAAVVRSKPIALRVGSHEVGARGFLADYVTYFLETSDIEEAHYVSSVLNSPAVDALIKPMQARGLWGPRDITKKVWEFPIPEYNQHSQNHMKLARIAEACEQKVKEMLPSLRKLFEGVRGPQAIGRARTAVREALKDELDEIDALVQDILE